MIKIHKFNEIVIELYNNKDELIHKSSSLLEYLDLKIQIKLNNLKDYYVIIDDERFDVDDTIIESKLSDTLCKLLDLIVFESDELEEKYNKLLEERSIKEKFIMHNCYLCGSLEMIDEELFKYNDNFYICDNCCQSDKSNNLIND